MQNNPLISVIIPYYNAGRFIEQALASIRAQHYTPIEIILIDDGSTDGIAEHIKTFGNDIIFIQQTNKGPAAARNAGIMRATGDILAFLDADDLWPEGKLTQQVEQLRSDSQLGLVTGHIRWTVIDGTEDQYMVTRWGNPQANVNLGAGIMWRSTWDTVGPLDETLRIGEDSDWFMRLQEKKIPTKTLDEVTLIYQLHNQNQNPERTPYDKHVMTVLKRSIDRRKSKQPLISVIIAVYNGGSYIAQAIESVLAQSWKNMEIIVINDGSTDETARIVTAYGDRIIYHFQKNQGQGAARNTGISMAKGEFIAFLDADDLWMPDKLSQQMALLQQHPDASMAFGMLEQFTSPELGTLPVRGNGDILLGYSPITLLIKRNALLKVGLFPTHLRVGEFISWYSLAKERGLQHVLLQNIVARRRIHNTNMGITHKDQRHDYLKVLKEVVARKRKT